MAPMGRPVPDRFKPSRHTLRSDGILLNERLVKRTMTDCRYRIRFHTSRAAGSKIFPTCWTGHGKKVRLNDLEDDEWDELALFKWNKRGLNPRHFCDERNSWGLRDCLTQMGAIDQDVLRFAVETIKAKRERQRNASMRSSAQAD